MEQRVPARIKEDFRVGSDNWNDVRPMRSKRQGIRWMKDPQSRPSIEVSQEKAIEELEEIPVEKNTKKDLHCTPTMHPRYRSLLGQINWVQSRTQFQCFYKFSKCDSRTTSPTIGDVKAINMLARQLQSQPSEHQLWPLTRPWRTVGFPDPPAETMKMGPQRGA